MSCNKTGSGRYLRTALTASTVLCAAVAGFNLVVDPFGAYRLVEQQGVNAAKPGLERRVKLAKAYDLRRLRPEAIVLGTSRSHVGLRTTHEGWAVPVGARYNAAFDGAMTQEMYAYLRHAHAIRPLRQVVLGLDTWQLGRGPASVRPDFDGSLVYVPGAPLHNLGVLMADLRLLLSADTLQASFRTLRSQDGAATEWLASDGQRLGPVFFYKFEPEFVAGPGDYFRSVDRQEIGYKLPGPAVTGKATLEEAASEETSFDYIAKIVTFCRENNIDLRIFLSPAHAHQLEIAWEMGEWPGIERGKLDLVALLARDAAANPEARPFRLYDFSGYSPVTMEPVPPPGSKDEMGFYWDSSHFKEIIGDWILDRLFEVGRESQPAPAGFGVELTVETVEAELARMRADHDAYRRLYPYDIEVLQNMIASAKTEQARVANSSPRPSSG